MGRSVASDRPKPKARDAKRSSMSASDMKSLASFMRKLQRDVKGESAKVVLPKVHRIIKQNKLKIGFDCRKLKEKLRICKKCEKWNKISSILQCAICEDNYHKHCLETEIETPFICGVCQKGGKTPSSCGKCKKNVDKSERKKCESCNNQFHERCLVSKYSKCRKCVTLDQKQKESEKFDPRKAYGKHIGSEETVNTSSSALFRYERLVKTQQDLIKYTKELMEAIKAKDMLYSQKLVNIEEYKDIFNENSMDFGINLMRKPEEDAYQQYKKCPIGPYLFQKIQGKGFDVIADKPIPQKSIICQYVGQVVTLRECIALESKSKNKNDSLMELQAGKNADETLIIRPEKFTNMARFINGVRKDREGNVETMKLLYKGRPIVLLVAKRLIKIGESLSYDYNAGGIAAEYDTSHFL